MNACEYHHGEARLEAVFSRVVGTSLAKISQIRNNNEVVASSNVRSDERLAVLIGVWKRRLRAIAGAPVKPVISPEESLSPEPSAQPQ